jgi:hypothetical protein
MCTKQNNAPAAKTKHKTVQCGRRRSSVGMGIRAKSHGLNCKVIAKNASKEAFQRTRRHRWSLIF